MLAALSRSFPCWIASGLSPFVLALLVLAAGRVSAFKAMLGGAVLGLLRSRLSSIPGR